MVEKYLVMWSSDNPSHYIQECGSKEEVEEFIKKECRGHLGEYANFIVCPDLSYITVRDNKFEWKK